MARSILFSIPYFDQSYGGPVTSVHALANSMVAKGFDVTVTTTTLGEQGTAEPKFLLPRSYKLLAYTSIVPALAWSQRFFLSPKLCWSSFHLIRKVSVVHMHDFFVFSHVFLATFCVFLKKPFVITPHGTLNLTEERGKTVFKKMFLLFFKQMYLQTAAKVIALTNTEKKALMLAGVDSKKIVVIPNIIFPVVAPQQRDIKLQQKHKTILYLGRMYEHKGVVELLEGFSLYCKDFNDSNTHLVFAGPDAGSQRILQKIVNERQINSQVQFLGTVLGESKNLVIHAATVVCLLSHAEGLPTTIVEAASAGKACIVSSGSNVPDLVAAGGAICTATNSAAVAKSLHTVLSSDQLRKKMGIAARRWYTTKHAPTTIQDTYVAMYNQLG